MFFGKSLLTVCAVAVLSACGGGGGSDTPVATDASTLSFNLNQAVTKYFTTLGQQTFNGVVSVTVNGVKYTGTSVYTITNEANPSQIYNDQIFSGATSYFYPYTQNVSATNDSNIKIIYNIDINGVAVRAFSGDIFITNNSTKAFAHFQTSGEGYDNTSSNKWYLTDENAFFNLPTSVKVGDTGTWFSQNGCYPLVNITCTSPTPNNTVTFSIEKNTATTALVKIISTADSVNQFSQYYIIDQNNNLRPYSQSQTIGQNSINVQY